MNSKDIKKELVKANSGKGSKMLVNLSFLEN
jgi:hypothetical protein